MFVFIFCVPQDMGLYFCDNIHHFSSLKALDLVTMKKLQQKVNIIPIIAKSDTITKQELIKFKAKVSLELKSNGIRVYEFPTDDENIKELNENTNVSFFVFPFHPAQYCSIYA